MNRPLIFGVDQPPSRGHTPRKANGRIDYTERAKLLIASGTHPLGDPLANNGETCGSCRYLSGHRYFKCSLYPSRLTASEATDIRKGWPACVKWEPEVAA